MKRKHIERAREVRLWISDVIIPGVMFVTTALAIPEVRQAVARKYANAKIKANNLKMKIKEKFKK